MTTEPSFQLAARGIRKAFGGVEVLHGVDLDVIGGSVLALLGENGAGKSTLVKIVAGDYEPDAGSVEIGGRSFASLTPVSAREQGIRMIFQELADAPTLTVAENIMLGRWPTARGIVRWGAVRRRAREVLDQLGVALDLDRPVGELAVGERQIVEIARALSDRARCLILDEPTAALSAQETERLFGFLRRLREQGVALVYITHRLDEVREIADRVAVLRDGRVALQGASAELDRRALVSAMVGRAVAELQRPEAPQVDPASAPLLRMESASRRGRFEDIALEVRPGEVVGLYGKLGSGIAEVAECCFGIRRLSGGTLAIDGREERFRKPTDAIRAGVGLLPADRQREGAFLVRSVAENLAAPSWGSLSRHGFLTGRSEARAYRRWHDELRIRSRDDPRQPLGTLSGGNQQKVLLGRWLERRSRLLVLIEPTRGVDVGAREEIYRSIRALAREGVGVLVATSDYEEVLQLADRAAVMARGRIVAWLRDAEITTERLIEEVGG